MDEEVAIIDNKTRREKIIILMALEEEITKLWWEELLQI